jgi:hypothetical protein
MKLNYSLPLVAADESSGGSFIVGGTLRLPPNSIAEAVRSIDAIKNRREVPPQAKIHCRELFAGSARLKSPFKHLKVEDCHALLAECVDAMLAHDSQWFGCYVNADTYPTELRLVEGATFPVTKKHLAGLAMASAIFTTGQITDEEFQLAFDPDPSKVDWGLANRTQATHFARIDNRSIELDPNERCILDMADIAAYVLAQSILCQSSPFDRKRWHLPFPDLLKQMRMQTAEFAYRPEG